MFFYYADFAIVAWYTQIFLTMRKFYIIILNMFDFYK